MAEEKKAEGKEEEGHEEEEGAKKKKKLPILWIIIGLLVVLGGVAAALFFMKGDEPKKGKGKAKTEHAKKAGEGEEEHEEEEPAEEEEHAEKGGEDEEPKGEEHGGGDGAEGGGAVDAHGNPIVKNCPAPEAGGHGAPKAPPNVFAFDPFIVNLSGDGSEVRFLKITIKLKLATPDCNPFVEPHTAEMRDSILMLLSSKEYDMIKTVQGKLELRDEILARVRNIEKHNRIKSAFFTEFVAQ